MTRVGAALRLTALFPWHVLVSGLNTVSVVLGAGRRGRRSGFVRMRHAPLGDGGTAVLACLICLTPGTSVVYVDPTRREFLLHLLDASDPEAVIAGIRTSFERPLAVLLGVEGEP